MKTKKKKKPLWKKLLIGVGICLAVVLAAAVWLLHWLGLSEFQPADVEQVNIRNSYSEVLYPGSTARIVTWNIGYGALGDNADFFMDGGSSVYTADEERVNENISAVISELAALEPDVIFLQEVDMDSDRSHGVNEMALIADAAASYQNTFAFNFSVLYIPYPIPPLGGVNSGIMTLNAYPVSRAERIQLPCPFSWPVRLMNLKRCLLVNRVPIYGTEKELVLVNLHLEAYDNGEGKIAQTEMLRELLQAEADAGNYVIAGGDFNQVFSSMENPYPLQEGVWQPGEIDVSVFSDSFQFAMDSSTPSCRSLDRPLADADPDDFQYYLIDGFIVSKELEIVTLQTQDLGFVNSDHNPVLLEVRVPSYW